MLITHHNMHVKLYHESIKVFIFPKFGNPDLIQNYTFQETN